MVSRFRRFLTPPEFPGDEDKTRQARVLHTLTLSAMLMLFFYGGVAIPFIFAEKLFNTLALMGLLAILGVTFYLTRVGRMRLASALFLGGVWLVFTFFLPFAGGMSSVVVIFYLVGTVIAGLLLGTVGALVFVAACCLAGLGMVLLDTSGHSLPRLFPVSPFIGWVDMISALLMTTLVLRLVLNSLREAQSLTQQRLDEQQKADEALRESEERFSRLSDAASEGIGISDQGRIVDANHQLTTMLGYEAGELIGLSAVDFVAPESRSLVMKNEEAGFEGAYEHLAMKKDGSIFPVEIRARTIPYKGRQCRVAIIRDITEHKRGEENLARQVERLRALHTIDQAITGSMDLKTILELLVREIVDQLHVDAASVLLLNPQTEMLSFAAKRGFQTEALDFTSLIIGNGLAGRAAKERRTVYVANLAEMDNNPSLAHSIADEGFIAYFGVPLIAKDQLRGVLEIFHRSALAPDPNWLTFLETLAGQAAISIDNVRLLEMTQASLKEINALYRINQDLASTIDPEQLMANVVDLLKENFGYHYVQIFVIDPETGDFIVHAGSGTIGEQLKNQGYRLAPGEGIVGYTAETGRPFFTNNVDDVISFIRAPYLPDTKSELAVPIKTGAQFLGLLDIHQAPPAILTERDVQLVSAVADQLAVALQKARLYTDLQNSLRQEQTTRSQLIHTEKLAVAGRLLASVSHELNNPLQAIQNALFLLKDESELSTQGQQDMKIILAETERMATLLDRLRTSYQPAHAEDFQPVQINAIIEDVQALLATHLRHANISFDFHSEPDLPSITGLGNQLKQVFINLFMNAVDAMTDGGCLTITTRWLAKRREILVIVADTGKGIDESLLPDIFEAFITNKDKGTGLGLAISYEIILKHHGRIQAENNPDGGAIFSIWLPLENGDPR
jgi:PAS domain S-box-containing protein